MALTTRPTPRCSLVRAGRPELDLHEGRAYVSLVGFLFLDTRALGVPLPFCGVRGGEPALLRPPARSRGPTARCRLREGAGPPLARHGGARGLFGEPYHTVPMRSRLETDDHGNPRPGGLLEYEWRWNGRWHRLSARAALPMGPVEPGSGTAFLLERHWGYTPRRWGALDTASAGRLAGVRGRRGGTRGRHGRP